MSTTLSHQQIAAVVAFHGHLCPGLAWGMRVSEAALALLGPRAQDEELVAVVETDNCAVDAIQFLTGCTFGKGNLRYLDHGQNVFTFCSRNTRRAVRISRNPDWQMPEQALDQPARVQAILEAPPEELLTIEELADYTPPEVAQILPSRACAMCGQPTMSSRLQVLAGRELCPECLAVELRNGTFTRSG
jgi:formylmethanofuran dehydrogenase subunit E